MSNGLSSSHFIFQTISIQLNSDFSHQPLESQQATVVEALAAALMLVDSSLSSAWTVRAFAEGSLCYELTPLPNLGLSIETAWTIVIALRDQPQIAAAEPVFV